jgi:methylenetetrahydrofolate reductase (NADPH)
LRDAFGAGSVKQAQEVTETHRRSSEETAAVAGAKGRMQACATGVSPPESETVIRFISEIHADARAAGQPAISFEFFPPKTEEGMDAFFFETLPALLEAKPDYCSVTYGAGGGTRDATLGMVERIQGEFGLTTMMHLTCVNHTREELQAVLTEAGARGVKNLLALRGDPPGGSKFVKADGGFEHSNELVAFIRETGGFDIAVAGFPEGHPDSAGDRKADWAFLSQKTAAGAQFVFTQLFFDNQDYWTFRDYVRGLGVKEPLVPGLLPIISRSQTKKFVTMCGAKLPEAFLARLDQLGDDNEAVTSFGIDYCTEQCANLLGNGAPGIHFYTLNKSRSTLEILSKLGIRKLRKSNISNSLI